MLEALQKDLPNLHPHLFTTVPESLFAETLNNFSYHPLSCDVGLVQKNGLQTDLPATITALQESLPFDHELVNGLASNIQECQLVLCDIAPLGILAAKRAGIISVLIENFTWDWIYKAYLPDHPELQQSIDYLSTQYQQADFHIRTEPVCGSQKGDLLCSPIFRRIRTPPAEIRQSLQCGNGPLILITMGGVDLDLPFVHQLAAISDTFFILAGQQETRRLAENVLLLSRNSGYYHPDLINSADLVICKSGYSTMAECVQSGVPIVTVGRTTFPESAVLEQFCTMQLNGQTLTPEVFLAGNWLKNLDLFFSDHKQAIPPLTGAGEAAQFIRTLL